MAARAYTSAVRTDAVRRTRDEILDAAIGLAYELERVDLTLDQIARRSGRSIQTLLRHFGSLDALIAAAVERGTEQVAAERRAPAGDAAHALELLVAHYESKGRFVLRLLARDETTVTGAGRLLHRGWVEQVFADAIARSREPVVLTDLLVVATDVYAWKLLRLDRGLTADEVGQRMSSMVEALIGGSR
ncbi:MAG: TetR/AcrR family transcriptional regulator [Pseudolysinimonas sp.]